MGTGSALTWKSMEHMLPCCCVSSRPGSQSQQDGTKMAHSWPISLFTLLSLRHYQGIAVSLISWTTLPFLLLSLNP